jgi:hypothetical protein
MIFILVLKNSPIRWLGGCLMPNEQFSTISWGEEVIIRWDADVSYVIDMRWWCQLCNGHEMMSAM